MICVSIPFGRVPRPAADEQGINIYILIYKLGFIELTHLVLFR